MAHLAGGGALVRVLRATHAQTHRGREDPARPAPAADHRPRQGPPDVIRSGQRVIADNGAALDLLLDVLPEGEDVTGLFATLAY